ncbi:MAG: ABC transporter ATP-binding protein, partial [Bacteroidia bacterium]|nr:ABC transporter ATP-binding protein [Bacteroidia bacterium]
MKARESLFASFKRAYQVFPLEYKIKYWISLALLFINSIIELIGLAAMLPVFSIMLKDNFIHENKFLFRIYEWFGFTSERNFALFLCAAMFAIILLKNVLSLLILRYQSRFSFSLYSYFSTQLLKYFYHLGYLNFKQHNSSFVVSYVNNHPSFFAQYFMLPILTLINEFTVVVLLISAIVIYSPQIVLLLACTVFPLSGLTYLYVRKKINGVGQKKAEYGALLNKSIHQSIEGYVDVKTLVKENYFFSLYKKLVNDNSRLNISSNVLMTVPTKVIETGMILGIISLLLYGLFAMQDKSQLTTLLGLFAISAYRILPSVNRMMASVLSIKEHQYTVDIITEIKPGVNYDDFTKAELATLSFENRISIENLSYAYSDNEQILNNISFEINKGETVGVIGRSGSGKTTLINILLRFLKEKEGFIKVDGIVLDEKNIREWRHLIGYVQQNVYIIDGTLAENIAFGIEKENVDELKLRNAIEAASLTELVSRLPKGVHTPVGERGAQISGGQRQRV